MAEHATVAVPAAPANCSGIDSVLTFVAGAGDERHRAGLGVGPDRQRAADLTRWAVAVLVTDTVGLASAR